jgi:hypothetical protein
MKFEIKNRKGELKMENENQKPKLSLDDIFNIKDEICNSVKNDCTNCPFNKNNLCSLLDDVLDYRDRIKTICTEWKNIPSLADKINEILKPYGMKLFNNSSTNIWIDDNNLHSVEEVRNKLETTKWKGEPNE